MLRSRSIIIATWLFCLLIALVVAGYPVAGFFAAYFDLPSRVMSIPFRLLVAGLALFLLGFAIWRHELRDPARACHWVKWTLFFFALYTTHLVANFITGYPNAVYQLSFFLLAVLLPVLALLFCDVRQSAPRVGWMIVGLCVFSIFAIIIGEYFQSFGDRSTSYQARLAIETVNPITLGHLALSLLLTVIALRVSLTRWTILPVFGMIGLGLVCLSYTGTRGAYLALLTSLGFFYLVQYQTLLKDFKRHALSLLILFLALFLFFKPLPFDRFILNSCLDNPDIQALWKLKDCRELISNDTVQHRHQFEDRGVTERLEILKLVTQQILKTPITGATNWQADPEKGRYPHNLILEAFLNLGVFGGGLFCLLVGMGLVFARRAILRGHYLYSLLYLQALSGNMVSGALFGASVFWVCFILLLKDDYHHRKDLETVHPQS